VDESPSFELGHHAALPLTRSHQLQTPSSRPTVLEASPSRAGRSSQHNSHSQSSRIPALGDRPPRVASGEQSEDLSGEPVGCPHKRSLQGYPTLSPDAGFCESRAHSGREPRARGRPTPALGSRSWSSCDRRGPAPSVPGPDDL